MTGAPRGDDFLVDLERESVEGDVLGDLLPDTLYKRPFETEAGGRSLLCFSPLWDVFLIPALSLVSNDDALGEISEIWRNDGGG